MQEKIKILRAMQDAEREEFRERWSRHVEVYALMEENHQKWIQKNAPIDEEYLTREQIHTWNSFIEERKLMQERLDKINEEIERIEYEIKLRECKEQLGLDK